MRGFLWQFFSDRISSFKQWERDLGKVIEVLQPGPLGIVEHKFSDADISRAKDIARKAVQRWKDGNQKKQCPH